MSIHIGAKVGDIAETVLLPGDPKRAKWIAENYLENVFCYTDIRGMSGFTGTYKGKKVSVQGTGMGIPSISIYITELMKDYGVKNLIRVGSAGSYQKDVKVRDVVIAMSTSTDSNINNRRFNGANFSPTANFELFKTALKVAEEKNIKIKAGNVLTSDEFYNDNGDYYRKWADFGVLAVEMEGAAIAQAAQALDLPFLVIRAMSDNANHEASISFDEFIIEAGRRSAQALLAFLKALN